MFQIGISYIAEFRHCGILKRLDVIEGSDFIVSVFGVEKVFAKLKKAFGYSDHRLVTINERTNK